MRKFYLFLATCLMAVMSLPVYSVIRSITINEGTKVNDMVPMAFSHCYSWTESEYIIPAASLSEINGKQITGLQYYVSLPTYYYTAHASMDIMVWEMSSSITTLSILFNHFELPLKYAQWMEIYEYHLENSGLNYIYLRDTVERSFLWSQKKAAYEANH